MNLLAKINKFIANLNRVLGSFSGYLISRVIRGFVIEGNKSQSSQMRPQEYESQWGIALSCKNGGKLNYYLIRQLCWGAEVNIRLDGGSDELKLSIFLISANFWHSLEPLGRDIQLEYDVDTDLGNLVTVILNFRQPQRCFEMTFGHNGSNSICH